MSHFTSPQTMEEDQGGALSAGGGITMTPQGPVLCMQPAVVTTEVTNITRTITSFAPIPLPSIPVPESVTMPYHLSSEQGFPLAAEPTPVDLRYLELNLGGNRVVVQEDGTQLPSGESGRYLSGPGWTRTIGTTTEPIGLTRYIKGNGKGKEKERKRPYEISRPSTAMSFDPEFKHEPAVGSSAGSSSNAARSYAPLRRSPPRKKPRPSDIVSPSSDSEPGFSPNSSPDDLPADPLQPGVGSGLEVAALFSLPSIMNQFELLPDKVQQLVMMQFLRRSRMPTIQRVSAFASTALKRDFLALLPHEIGLQVLRWMDAKSLTVAARVSRHWRKMVDSERMVWRERLVQDGLWHGHGVEEEEEKLIRSRFETLDWHAKQQISKAGTPSEDEPMLPELPRSVIDDRATPLKHLYRRRYVNDRNWLHRKPKHTSFVGHGTHVVTCVQFDEDKIVSASDDHSINIYDTKTGQLRKRLDGHEGGVWALKYKGDTLVTGSTDRTVRIWDLEHLQQTHLFLGHTSTVRCLEIVEPVLDEATGEYQPPYPVIVTGSRDASLRVWKLPKKGEPEYESNGHAPPEHSPFHVHHLQGHSEAVRAIATHGRLCVSGSYDRTVRVWDIVKGTCLHVMEGHEAKVYSIVYDKYRNRCASGSMDHTIKLWDIGTGECLQTFTGHTSLVGLLGMSPNNIVSAAADASLRVWDANTHELKHLLSSHAAAITCFQHDETKVVSGSDGTLKLWDIRTGRFVADLITGITSVWQVAFHGGLLVAASQRNDSTVFDVFDFGKVSDPSGVDDPRLDTLRGPPWARGNPREPHTYQANDSDSESGDEPVWIDVGGMSPDTVQRWKGLSVQAGSRSQRGAKARFPSSSDASTPVGGRHSNRAQRLAAARSREIRSEPSDDRSEWTGGESSGSRRRRAERDISRGEGSTGSASASKSRAEAGPSGPVVITRSSVNGSRRSSRRNYREEDREENDVDDDVWMEE